MIQEGDEEGDIDEVGPNMIIRDKKDLMNTAQVETFVEVKV
jgi:bifunctional N-acetylglucosamine-1-phosphate-uridyltransferase/glucosamine-1-phosphate-acetyltransferase GlmU-like protein